MQSTQRDFLWHLLTHLQWLGRVTLEQRISYLRRKTKQRWYWSNRDRTGQICDGGGGGHSQLLLSPHLSGFKVAWTGDWRVSPLSLSHLKCYTDYRVIFHIWSLWRLFVEASIRALFRFKWLGLRTAETKNKNIFLAFENLYTVGRT